MQHQNSELFRNCFVQQHRFLLEKLQSGLFQIYFTDCPHEFISLCRRACYRYTQVLNRPHRGYTHNHFALISSRCAHIHTVSRVFHSLTSYQPPLCKLSTGRKSEGGDGCDGTVRCRSLYLALFGSSCHYLAKQPNSFIVWIREIEMI